MLVFSRHALILAFSACIAGSAGAQSADTSGGGRPSTTGQFAHPAQVLNLGHIGPTVRIDHASVASGGVGLRNREQGGIDVSGVTTPIKRALMYWAVITNGAPPAAVSQIDVKRGGIGASFTTLTGTRIGQGTTPCWQGDRITVYRADIPLSIATGNAFYPVRLRPGANGSINGEDPWSAIFTPPFFEGASIVLIGTGNATVAVYDAVLAGKTLLSGQISYQLVSPVSVASSPEVLFHNIGADGQIGSSVAADPQTSAEVTTLNSLRIAGPGSAANDSDWNGAIAGPLPQLWDDTAHNVTSQARAGAPTLLPFVVSAPFDCIVPVANVLSIRPAS